MPHLKAVYVNLESPVVKLHSGKKVQVSTLSSDVQRDALVARKELCKNMYTRFDDNLEQRWREDLYVAILLDPGTFKHLVCWLAYKIPFLQFGLGKEGMYFIFFLFIFIYISIYFL